MFDLDNWNEIYASLARNRLRTALTAFGVFWGIFMLVVMLGSGNGLAHGAEAALGDTASNGFFLWTQRTAKPYRGLPAGRSFDFNNADVEAIRRQVPEAEVVAPRNQLGGYRGGNNVTRGEKSGAFSIMGDYPEVFRVLAVDVERGRFLNALDLEERRKVAVIGSRVREVLFEPEEDPLGENIEVQGVYFKVVGVFDTTRSGEHATRDVQTLYVPFTTFQNAFNVGDEVGWFAILARPGVPASKVEEKVRALMAERHRVAPEDTRAFGSFNFEEEFGKIQGMILAIRTLIWIVGIGTLAAGVIGVSNIMLFVVKERTREIGLRRAVGATPWAITGQVLLEAMALTALAGYLGLLAGVGLLEVARLGLANLGDAGGGAAMFREPGVDLANVLYALLILALAGALAGLLPARRALAVSPVTALRAE